MSAVWKFQLEMTRFQTVPMPKGARIIHVAAQFEKPCIWAIVDPHATKEPRSVGMLTTGETFNDAEVAYCGSFMLRGGTFVGHIVEPVTPSDIGESVK